MGTTDIYNKLRGGYYTPPEISRFLASWAINSGEEHILEPSCGDGSFISAVANRLEDLGHLDNMFNNVLGIELDAIEAEKAGKYGAHIINDDFFSYYREHKEEKFNIVLGNPPFIRYQNFIDPYREIAFELLNEYNFHPNKLTNIWIPFLLLSCHALSENGKLAMVIPAELFQVKYAAETRVFLSEFFEHLILITFDNLVFNDIQQEIILLLGERTSTKHGIETHELTSLTDLECLDLSSNIVQTPKNINHSSDKWTKYFLSAPELDLLSSMQNHKVHLAEELLEVNVGLVSGENNFFVLNGTDVKKNDLEKHVLPIISRTEQLNGLILTKEDFYSLVSANKKVYLFAPSDAPYEELTYEEQCYIDYAEKEGINNNYKCRIRKPWYHIKQTWKPEAFVIRQANLCPRIILNNADALVTDTIHKIRFKEGISGESVTAAFINSYTLAVSETLGRSYGGGVLTFEPSEIRQLPIPMKNANLLDIEKIDSLQRQGKLRDILTYTDKILLHDGIGLSNSEIDILYGIWNKLKNRRMSRKKSK